MMKTTASKEEVLAMIMARLIDKIRVEGTDIFIDNKKEFAYQCYNIFNEHMHDELQTIIGELINEKNNT